MSPPQHATSPCAMRPSRWPPHGPTHHASRANNWHDRGSQSTGQPGLVVPSHARPGQPFLNRPKHARLMWAVPCPCHAGPLVNRAMPCQPAVLATQLKHDMIHWAGLARPVIIVPCLGQANSVMPLGQPSYPSPDGHLWMTLFLTWSGPRELSKEQDHAKPNEVCH